MRFVLGHFNATDGPVRAVNIDRVVSLGTLKEGAGAWIVLYTEADDFYLPDTFNGLDGFVQALDEMGDIEA